MKLPYDVNRIANLLTLHGVPTEEITDCSDVEDGYIVITKKIHVQVGEDYLNIIKDTDEGLVYDEGSYDYRPGQLVNRLKELLR